MVMDFMGHDIQSCDNFYTNYPMVEDAMLVRRVIEHALKTPGPSTTSPLDPAPSQAPKKPTKRGRSEAAARPLGKKARAKKAPEKGAKNRYKC